jgi:putative ABC transport system permease protein
VLAGEPNVFLYTEQPFELIPATLRLLALIASAIVALGVVAIATALNLPEARYDLATLAAVGASPRIRRTFTAVQAGSLATIGGLLAVPAGLVPSIAVVVARGDDYPVIVPWLAIAVAVAVVPMLAAAGGALLTRSRLVLLPRVA